MTWFTALLMCFCCTLTYADNETIIVYDQPKWKAECGSCHIAYPPQLLTGGGWHRLMGELDKHFGVDASIDANDAREIENFLLDNAGLRWGGKNSESGMRISDTPWFIRVHGKIPRKIMYESTINGPAHCTACHVLAERGDWSRSSIKIPLPKLKLQQKQFQESFP
jgi:hypothetical protein